MPIDNAFRHQVYSGGPPATEYEVCRPTDVEDLHDIGDPAGPSLRNAGVQGVVLVHGTFTGNDALGLVRGLESMFPTAGDRLRAVSREWIDWIARDVGHYSDPHLTRFRELLGAEAATVSVRRFMWSGENHHLGRADGAIRLIDQLREDAEQGCLRFLLWGHSHAGNVFALVTNLLAGPPTSVEKFFTACRPLFFSSQVSQADQDRWRRVQHWLVDRRDMAESLRLDIVTFGTPIRYGWETRGYRQLLHFVHHRPAEGLPDYLVPFPFTWDDMLAARQGDYVQQLGIAGTDFPPAMFSWQAFRAERRLERLLQPGLTRRDTLQRLQLGMRVADEGTVLLVDYPQDAEEQRQWLLGHGIYTSLDWLPYHLQQVVRRFYAAP